MTGNDGRESTENVASRTCLRVGTAGWSIPKQVANDFPAEGSTLARYAGRFNAVEINSTFYRSHRRSTYENWAASVPAEFRFAVKLRKTISHELRLVNADREIEVFFDEVSALGPKLGPLLLQLPPSLAFDARVARRFFRAIRLGFACQLACEPRHPTWFSEEAGRLLKEFQVTRVAADPARVPEAADFGGWNGVRYVRLHGSPQMYYSSYSKPYLAQLAARLAVSDVETWCIFDNTASGAAGENALEMIGTGTRP